MKYTNAKQIPLALLSLAFFKGIINAKSSTEIPNIHQISFEANSFAILIGFIIAVTPSIPKILKIFEPIILPTEIDNDIQYFEMKWVKSFQLPPDDYRN